MKMDKTEQEIIKQTKAGKTIKEIEATGIADHTEIVQVRQEHGLGKHYTAEPSKHDINTFKKALVRKAERFWKDKKDIPEHGSLNWLLEPEFGAERASILIRSRRILTDEPLVAGILGIRIKVNKDE